MVTEAELFSAKYFYKIFSRRSLPSLSSPGEEGGEGRGHQHPLAPVQAGRGWGARVQAVLHRHEQPPDRGHLDRVCREVGALNPRHRRGRACGQMERGGQYDKWGRVIGGDQERVPNGFDLVSSSSSV